MWILPLRVRDGCLDDLAKAVGMGCQALSKTSRDDPDYAGRLDLLGLILGSRYKRLGSMRGLEAAVQLSRKAAVDIPANNSDLARRLNNLGNILESRFGRTGRMEDLEEVTPPKPVIIVMSNSVEVIVL